MEWEWATEHLKDGRAQTLSGFFEHDPELGWRLRANVHTAAVVTNSDGIRDSREISPDPPAGEVRIVLVGDSFTFGDGNNDHETFGWYLQQSLGPGAIVLNFGVPSYGADQSLLMYEWRTRRFHSRIVILAFFLHDYVRDLYYFRDYAKPLFVPDGSGLRLANVPVIAPDDLLAQYRSGQRRIGAGLRCWACGLVARAIDGASMGWFRESAPGFIVLSRILQRFQTRVKADGAEPVLLVLPNDDDVYDPHSRWAGLEQLVVASAQRMGLRCLSVTPALRAFAAEHPD